MFTSGYEITTAATNVFNAIVTAIFGWKLYRDIKPNERKALWGIVFILFFIVCVLGSVVHGVQITPEVKDLLWNILFFILVLMMASFVTAIVYETDGLSKAKQTAVPALLLGAVYLILRLTIPAVKQMRFTAFSIYAVVLLVYAIIKLVAVRKEKPYVKNFLYGIICLVVGSLAQTMKFIKFHFIYDFNYNSVYHLFTLFLLLFVYKGLKESQKYPNS